jgi:hypothetical protein
MFNKPLAGKVMDTPGVKYPNPLTPLIQSATMLAFGCIGCSYPTIAPPFVPT